MQCRADPRIRGNVPDPASAVVALWYEPWAGANGAYSYRNAWIGSSMAAFRAG